MKRPLIKCATCKGSGQYSLSDPLWQCLRIVERLKDATAIQIHTALSEPIKRSATNGRLAVLEELGFVKRERRGGKYFYRLNNHE